MHRHNAPVSLADLSAAGVRLRPFEAATIVRELVLQVARGDVAGVPSSQVIRLSGSGVVSVEGPVGADGPSVKRAAQLLDSLLPPMDAVSSQYRVPGGLRLVVARGMGALDLPPFASLAAFADALSRFAATDAVAVVSTLVVTSGDNVAAKQPVAAPVEDVKAPTALARVEPFVATRTADAHVVRNELTVSDIRRARRATGLTLTQVARRSRIPLALLRQLEWGYLLNWPSGRYGQTQLVRYARSAGLDEQVVLSTITPLIVEAEARRRALLPQVRPVRPSPPIVDEPVVEVEVLRVQPVLDSHLRTSRSRIAVAAAAVMAMASLVLVPSFRSNRGAEQAEQLPAVVTVPPPSPSVSSTRVSSAPPSVSAPVPATGTVPASSRQRHLRQRHQRLRRRRSIAPRCRSRPRAGSRERKGRPHPQMHPTLATGWRRTASPTHRRSARSERRCSTTRRQARVRRSCAPTPTAAGRS